MFKKIIQTSLSKTFALLITFLIGVIISRQFGPSGKGLIALLVLIPTMISAYFGVSIEEGFLYYIGKNKINKNTFDKLILKILSIFIPAFFIIFTFVYLFLDFYTYNYIPQLLLIFGTFLRLIFQFSLKGLLDFYLFNFFEIIRPLLIMMGLLLFIFLNKLSITIIWIYSISELLVLFFQYIFIRKKLYSECKEKSFLDLLRYSYKVHFFKILNFTEAKFDLLLIGIFLSVSDVGIYSVVISFSLIFQTLIQSSISTVLLPNLVKLELKEKIAVTIKYYRISFSLAIIFLISIYLFGSDLITIIYGNDFSLAYFPLLILLFGSLIKSPSPCLNSYFKSIGLPEQLYKVSIFSLTFNIISCFILIPEYGIIGAAISSSISYFIYGSIMLYKFKLNTNIKIKQILIGL